MSIKCRGPIDFEFALVNKFYENCEINPEEKKNTNVFLIVAFLFKNGNQFFFRYKPILMTCIL